MGDDAGVDQDLGHLGVGVAVHGQGAVHDELESRISLVCAM